MCRMFGMAAKSPSSLHELLYASQRSLRTLSHEHAHGWGIALHDGQTWSVERGTTCAASSARYAELATRAAWLAIAHVRKATVGTIAPANTHPFERDGFVFAHNGTIATAAVVAQTAPEYLAQIAGETDSERLFAFVRTHVAAAPTVERGIRGAVRALQRLGDIGAATFVFSCGAQLYAYRSGRTLFTLERDDATVIASEPLDGGAWREVAEGSLVAIDTTSVTSLAA